jgi:hypothetical protein
MGNGLEQVIGRKVIERRLARDSYVIDFTVSRSFGEQQVVKGDAGTVIATLIR